MSEPVIRVENLGKHFIIGHEKAERYTALRDVIANNVKGLVRKTGNIMRGKIAGEDETTEEFWALKDVSFEIKQGDRVGIIGRNGAGKSTLLKVLSRITEPTKGRISIRGRVASLLEVGTGFHPELSGRENIFLNGAILGMGRNEIRKKFDEIVDFAEVEKFLDTPVKRYSSGMYVRLAFAVAAHLEPEILIVDEVLAVGDAQFQKKCLGKMEDVSKNGGRTVLFVSHNMGTIAQLCNAGILLNKGRVEQAGDIKSIMDTYLFSNLINEVYEHDGSGKHTYFKKIFTADHKGGVSSEFSFENPLRLGFEFVLEREIPDLVVGIGLNDKYNNRVFTVFKNASDFSSPDGRNFSGAMEIPGGLIAPNNYSWDCALWIPNQEIFDSARGICGIRIHDSGTALAKFEGTDYGNIILNPKWSRS